MCSARVKARMHRGGASGGGEMAGSGVVRQGASSEPPSASYSPCLSQICRGLLPMLYRMLKKPDWKLREAVGGGGLVSGPGTGAEAEAARHLCTRMGA